VGGGGGGNRGEVYQNASGDISCHANEKNEGYLRFLFDEEIEEGPIGTVLGNQTEIQFVSHPTRTRYSTHEIDNIRMIAFFKTKNEKENKNKKKKDNKLKIKKGKSVDEKKEHEGGMYLDRPSSGLLP